MHLKLCRYVSCAKRSHPGLVFNFVCLTPVPVVSGPGKVLKMLFKHSSVVLTENDKNRTANSLGIFRVQNRVICPGFQPLLLWNFLGSEKSSKFVQNIFQPYGREIIRTTP